MRLIAFILIIFSTTLVSQNRVSHDVFFDTDKYDITKIETKKLLYFISKLDTTKIQDVVINGYCDDRGSLEYNLRLSQKRANAIKSFFNINQIRGTLITNVDGQGEVALNATDLNDIQETRSNNRKVTVVVILEDERLKNLKLPKNAKTFDDFASGNIKKGDKVIFRDLLFKKGYNFLIPESKKRLEEITKVVLANKNIFFTIEGHVCCTADDRDAINRLTRQRSLSHDRAKYIYDYLIKRGVDKRRMKHLGMRHKFPLGGDEFFDRRVEFKINYIAGKTASNDDVETD